MQAATSPLSQRNFFAIGGVAIAGAVISRTIATDLVSMVGSRSERLGPQ